MQSHYSEWLPFNQRLCPTGPGRAQLLCRKGGPRSAPHDMVTLLGIAKKRRIISWIHTYVDIVCIHKYVYIYICMYVCYVYVYMYVCMYPLYVYIYIHVYIIVHAWHGQHLSTLQTFLTLTISNSRLFSTGDLANPEPKEPEVYDEIYKEADYQWWTHSDLRMGMKVALIYHIWRGYSHPKILAA